MKERIFNAKPHEVRALLTGAKTQHRWVMAVQPDEHATVTVEHYNPTVIDRHGDEQPGAEIFGAWWADGDCGLRCPYGQPGDRFWMREATHRRPMLHLLTGEPLAPKYDGGAYTADGEDVLDPQGFDIAWWYSRKSCPSIHMPRWASRCTLEITDVRVQRLQEISEADAWSEGIDHGQALSMGCTDGAAVAAYSALWESINGPASSWDLNPWVWCISFRRINAS
jgi:hypothetical protein